ncbi:BEM_collapsed_G0045570.mRNA.1.CDS.1 [Saccharomyces cerevisiae]|nr:BEM_collapsed_G0045570.mRNA.1.CDS.1 [Saccharomyces cerevisiae]
MYYLLLEDQIRGEDASYETVHDATGINCKPLSKNADGKIYYPCSPNCKLNVQRHVPPAVNKCWGYV